MRHRLDPTPRRRSGPIDARLRVIPHDDAAELYCNATTRARTSSSTAAQLASAR